MRESGSIAPRLRVTMLKLTGCIRTYGVRETFRRVRKELGRGRRRGADPDRAVLTEWLAVGAAPRAGEGIGSLTDAGFTHVLDLRAERRSDDPLATTGRVVVIWVPVWDDWRPKPAALLRDIAEAVRAVRRREASRLFVCCAAGEHRGPLGAVIALCVAGYELDAAIDLVAARRSQAEFLPMYRRSLEEARAQGVF